MSDDSDVPRLSVADALTNNVGLSRDHVQYKTLVARTQRKMADMVTKLEDMKRSSTPCFVTIALLPDEMRTLRDVFPDFRMVDLGRMRVCHPLWSQLRRCATLWCLNQARKLTDSVAVYSPCLLDVNEMGFEKARVLVDANSAVAVHERHNAAMDAFNVYRDFVRIGKGSSVALKKSGFDDFCHGRGGLKVASYSKTTSFQYEKVDSLVIDGVLNDFSPLEVASMMRLHGASVAYGYIPYHPEMLMNLDGEIPGTGVHYTRTDAMLYLKYPEGTAGLVEYPMYSWSAWLTGHTFALGSSTAKSELRYQLELMNVRGGLLFYRIVHTPDVPLDMEIFHALDLPMSVPSYVVTSWRMRNLGLDPNKRDNWDQRRYLVSKRLVDRVYQFAMQLPREQFTRFAIRKQIRVANDRVTVEGTSVKVNSPVGNEIVDALVVDIFSRAFVDRYESGELTEFAKDYVNKLTSFSSSSTSQKLWMLCTISAVHVWEVTIEPVSKSIAALADAARAFFRADRGLTAAKFEIAPTYVRLGGYADGLRRNGSADLARELSRQAGFYSRGPASVAVRAICQRTTERVEPSFQFKAVAYPLFTTAAAVTQIVDEVVGYMKKLNPVDEPPSDRRAIEVIQAARQISDEREIDFEPVADPVHVFNEMYSAVLPGVSAQNNEYDIASISFDPQDRQLVAPWLRIPLYMGDAPKAKIYYHSKIRALNVPKRQQTLQELLSAVASRQLAAPTLQLPDDMAAKARVVWEFFLDKACVPDARQKLATYQLDQVGLEEEAFREWASQSTPDKVRAVREELSTMHQSLAEMPVQDYIIMLKSDVKPTLSQKPIESRTEAQVIVYHAKALSAFYSCVFRVLVRRFLSIIRPNIHVNLLKDMVDIGDFVRGVHPFEKTGLRYLENDFSKYDKSQGLLAWELEHVAFSALGMNSQLLSAWLGGHVECNLRSLSLGLSLHVMFQRKSGDATTAFGNVLLNIVSVTYAYAGANVIWALFMGDDSLLCVDRCDDGDRAVRILAEDFNLSAKTYLSDSPYFASNFLLIDDFNHLVHFVPDPIKRIERWSMMINAEDPQWDERYISARDSMRAYLNKSKTVLLPKLMAERYNAPPSVFNGIADAMATAVADKSKFRAMWNTHSEVSNY